MAFAENNCMPGASCTNFEGGYSCPCADGYFALDFGCYDYDECAMGDDDCSASGTICVNQPGGYSCHGCPTGFHVDSDGNCSDGKMFLWIVIWYDELPFYSIIQDIYGSYTVYIRYINYM